LQLVRVSKRFPFYRDRIGESCVDGRVTRLQMERRIQPPAIRCTM
jgi:hypothetical protein